MACGPFLTFYSTVPPYASLSLPNVEQPFGRVRRGHSQPLQQRASRRTRTRIRIRILDSQVQEKKGRGRKKRCSQLLVPFAELGGNRRSCEGQAE